MFISVSSTCMSDCYGNVATASQISAQASSDKLIRYQHRQAQTSSSVTTAHQIRSLAQCRLSSVPCRSLCFELTAQSSCFTFSVLTVLQPDIVQAPQDGASEKPSKEFEHSPEQEQAKSAKSQVLDLIQNNLKPAASLMAVQRSSPSKLWPVGGIPNQ